MTTVDAPPRPRAFWADARFLLGIVLIIGSVAGVWAVVASARQTTPALAAARTLVPGQPISADDLQVVDVALGAVGEAYLAPGSLLDDAVATRTIGPGELIAQSAVGAAADARTTTVVLHTSGDVPASIVTGAMVEVWAAIPLDRGRFDTPSILVPTATVLSVSRGDSVMGGGETALEIVISRSDVAATLAAVADGSSISVVPVIAMASGTDTTP